MPRFVTMLLIAIFCSTGSAEEVFFKNVTSKDVFQVFVTKPNDANLDGSPKWIGPTKILGVGETGKLNVGSGEYLIYLRYQDDQKAGQSLNTISIDASSVLVMIEDRTEKVQVNNEPIRVPIIETVFVDGKKQQRIRYVVRTHDETKLVIQRMANTATWTDTSRRKAYSRLGVEVRKCNEGIHVEWVHDGSPATRLRRISGGDSNIRLDPNDHIVVVNGIQPKSTKHFFDLMNQSRQQMNFVVKDVRTGNLIHLVADLPAN